MGLFQLLVGQAHIEPGHHMGCTLMLRDDRDTCLVHFAHHPRGAHHKYAGVWRLLGDVQGSRMGRAPDLVRVTVKTQARHLLGQLLPMPAGIVRDKGHLHTTLAEGVERLDSSREQLVPAIQDPIHIHRHMCEHLHTLPSIPPFASFIVETLLASAEQALLLPVEQMPAFYTVSCCVATPASQYSRRGSLSRGRASLTVSGRSWRSAPCRAVMAALASSAFGIST